MNNSVGRGKKKGHRTCWCCLIGIAALAVVVDVALLVGPKTSIKDGMNDERHIRD